MKIRIDKRYVRSLYGVGVLWARILLYSPVKLLEIYVGIVEHHFQAGSSCGAVVREAHQSLNRQVYLENGVEDAFGDFRYGLGVLGPPARMGRDVSCRTYMGRWSDGSSGLEMRGRGTRLLLGSSGNDFCAPTLPCPRSLAWPSVNGMRPGLRTEVLYCDKPLE